MNYLLYPENERASANICWLAVVKVGLDSVYLIVPQHLSHISMLAPCLSTSVLPRPLVFPVLLVLPHLIFSWICSCLFLLVSLPLGFLVSVCLYLGPVFVKLNSRYINSHWNLTGEWPARLDTTPENSEMCHVWFWWNVVGCLIKKYGAFFCVCMKKHNIF